MNEIGNSYFIYLNFHYSVYRNINCLECRLYYFTSKFKREKLRRRENNELDGCVMEKTQGLLSNCFEHNMVKTTDESNI